MTSNLESRLQRIEAKAPEGRIKMFVADSREDARAKHAEKKANGEIVDADRVVWLFITAAEPGDLGGEVQFEKVRY